MAKARIPLPKNPTEMLALGKKVFDKHQAEGSKSPLAGLADEWAPLGPQIADALTANEEAEQLRKQMEAAYERRDNAVAATTVLVQRSRDILQGHFGAANVRKMGDFGFTVDDSPRADKSDSTRSAGK